MQRQDSLKVPGARGGSPHARPPIFDESYSSEMEVDAQSSTTEGHQPGDHTSSQSPHIDMTDIPFSGSREDYKRLQEVKKKIDEGPFNMSLESETNLLGLEQCSPDVRKKAIRHAWRRVEMAFLENNLLRNNFPMHRNAQCSLQQWIHLNTSAGTFIVFSSLDGVKEGLIEDPRFERTVATLAKLYHEIKAVNGSLVNQTGDMNLLINWFENKDRLHYERGDSAYYLEQAMFTAEMLKELALYGYERNTDLRDRYQELVDEAEFVYEGNLPGELELHIKDPEIDLIPQPDPRIKSTFDFFDMGIEKIQSYDLNEINRLRSHWAGELAILARQAHSIIDEQKMLKDALERLEQGHIKH